MTTPPAPLGDCAGCHRPLRRRSDPTDDTSVVHKGRGLCGTCHTSDRLTEGYARPGQPRPATDSSFPTELLTPAPIRPGWQDDAACAQIGDPEAWFPNTGPAPDAVTDTCLACPVRRDCLETAMAHEGDTSQWHRAGIWGALGAVQRARLARARHTHNNDKEAA